MHRRHKILLRFLLIILRERNAVNIVDSIHILAVSRRHMLIIIVAVHHTIGILTRGGNFRYILQIELTSGTILKMNLHTVLRQSGQGHHGQHEGHDNM